MESPICRKTMKPLENLTLGLRFVPNSFIHALALEVLVLATSDSEPINGDLLTAVEHTAFENRVYTGHGGQ